MSTSNNLGIGAISLAAEEAINQYDLVKIGAADFSCLRSAAITDNHLGIALESRLTGEQVPVQPLNSLHKMKGSGAITRGDRLMWATGTPNRVATLAGATAKIVGVALHSAAAGDFVQFLGAGAASVNDTQ